MPHGSATGAAPGERHGENRVQSPRRDTLPTFQLRAYSGSVGSVMLEALHEGTSRAGSR